MRLRSQLLAILLVSAALPAAADDLLAFPGAQGWAAHTPGGRGGKIMRVTTLAASGPGSLLAAMETDGPRIVVFEVGGVIDLAQHDGQDQRAVPHHRRPDGAVARHHADPRRHRRRHARCDHPAHPRAPRRGRAAEAQRLGRRCALHDRRRARRDRRPLLVHLGDRREPVGVRARASPARRRTNGAAAPRTAITFSNNIIAEGLADSTHAKGEHSKGSLIHDNVTDILIVGNLYAHNHERSPLFKGGVRGAVVNNLIYDPGQRAVHYNLIAEEWGDHAVPDRPDGADRQRAARRPVDAARPRAVHARRLGRSRAATSDDNIAVDRVGRPLPKLGRYTNSSARHRADDAPHALPLKA